jgi:ATP-dependent RNA helicase RhlE
MPPEIQQLADEILTDPMLIQVAPHGTPAGSVRQVVHPVAQDRKRDLLLHLLEKQAMDQVLIFTRTKHRADYLEQQLQRKGKKVAALHSNKSQSARTRALDSFRRGSVQILVATNIAARGLDIKGVSHVVNYEFPESPEDYVHRIGRTGRASETGDAISFMAPHERESLREVEQLIGKKLELIPMEGFEISSRETVPSGARRPFRQRTEQRRGDRRPAYRR